LRKDPKDLEDAYFGLITLVWWDKSKIEEGHEYLPEIREYVLEKWLFKKSRSDTDNHHGIKAGKKRIKAKDL